MTSTTTLTRIAAALLLTALIASGCGGGDDEADQAFIDALTVSAEENFPPEVDAGCVAEALVSGVGGASALEETYGLEPADFEAADFDIALSQGDSSAFVEGLWECDGAVDSMYTDFVPAGDTEAASCLQEVADQGLLKALMTSAFMGDAGADLEASVENAFEADLTVSLEICGAGS